MSDHLATFHCDYVSRCSGCGWHNVTYEDQKRLKIEAFAKAWSDADLPPLHFQPAFRSIAQGGLRDRVDLIIDNRSGSQKTGMFDHEHKEIIDLSTCAQLSPSLQLWFEEFRKIKWPIQRGSVRLRISPNGERGVWLDFANADVKSLLDERSILLNLLTQSTVEIGQRRKLLVNEDRLRLKDRVFMPWFQTYLGEKFMPTPLLCNIGGFTQPGFRANRVLIEEVFNLIRYSPIKRIAEFGSGVGNFTLPLAFEFESVDAFEIDQLACNALAENLKSSKLENKVRIHQGDFQNLNERRTFNASDFDAVFVDPPRSGLKQFIEPFFASKNRPKYFVYVSCYPESFCKDTKRLYELGYTMKTVTIIDQFPQTPHAELAAYFITN